MFNNQDFMELGWRNDVVSLAQEDHGITEIARSDEDLLVNGLKWSYGPFDHGQTYNHLQIVPEIQKKEEVLKTDLLVVVPDEHSETGDYHDHINDDYSDSSNNLCYLRNKHEKPKRRRVTRIQILSDEESEGFTREVPSLTRKGFKRRRRDHELSNKMRTLQQLLPNCHKADTVSVLDNAIEYMKNLQLQLQVMSTMGMNPYLPPATAMALAHNQNPANQKTSSPLIPASNWPLQPSTILSFPHSSYQSLFYTTASPASSPQCLYGLVPLFPKFP